MSTESEVVAAGPNDELILLRGCNGSQLARLQQHNADPASPAPTEAEARAQVGEQPFGDVIEFTTDPTVAQRFGTGGHVAAIQIKKKYLTKGSVSESGWLCKATAPWTFLDSRAGRAFLV